jgi:hypothetical protein
MVLELRREGSPNMVREMIFKAALYNLFISLNP